MRANVFSTEREQQLWLNVTQQNPKQEGETFWDWMERLSALMASSRKAEPEVAKRMGEEG